MRTNQTSCSDVIERLPLFVGGDLDGAAEELVRAHLARCAACGRESERALRSREAFRASLPFTLSTADVDLWPGLRLALEDEGRIARRASARPRLRLVRRTLSFAAAAAVLVALPLVGARMLDRPDLAPGVVVDPVDGPVAVQLDSFELPHGLTPRLEAGENRLEHVAPGERTLHEGSLRFSSGRAVPVVSGGDTALASTAGRVDVLR